MDNYIKEFVEDFFDIASIEEYSFHEIYGFTLTFKKETVFIDEQIASAEIKPIAIIYEENGEYYLAPIDVVDEIDEVVKEFVEQQLQN